MVDSPTFVGIGPDDRKAVLLGELARGRETADRLRHMVRHQTNWAYSVFTFQGLVDEILDSFTHSISMLTAADSDEVSQASGTVGLKTEDSGESSKPRAPAARKEKRGCYKRRRSSETWVKESPTQFDDGHAWRKYGQKTILNANHPRSYFRCTHKFDQGCQASKQVQKIEDDPPLYQTTYQGGHTCKYVFKPSDAAPAQGSPINQQEKEKGCYPVFDGDVLSPDHVYSCSASIYSMEMDINDFLDFEILS